MQIYCCVSCKSPFSTYSYKGVQMMNIHELYNLWIKKNYHDNNEVLTYAVLLQQIDSEALNSEAYSKYFELKREIISILEATI